jgi:transcriptional regulator with PAS, ATPase and Fis domain
LVLLTLLIASLSSNVSWIIHLTNNHYLTFLQASTLSFISRFFWIFTPIEDQALALFVEYLAQRKQSLSLYNKCTVLVSFSMTIIWFIVTCFNFNHVFDYFIINYLYKIQVYFKLFFLMGPTLFIALRAIKHKDLPPILGRQLTTFLMFLFVPQLLNELLENMPLFITTYYPPLLTDGYAMATFSVVFEIGGLYFCVQKLLRMRLINVDPETRLRKKFPFLNHIKKVLNRLSYASSYSELAQITQTFFKEVFHIPIQKTKLYVRDLKKLKKRKKAQGNLQADHIRQLDVENLIEEFLENHPKMIHNYAKQESILFFDEVESNNFYLQHQQENHLYKLLDEIGADFIIPIFDEDLFIAYLVVEHHTRRKGTYISTERDEIEIFAGYLNAVVHIVKLKNIDDLLAENRILSTQLYAKTEEINYYKESFKSFLREPEQRKIGIVFYKNQRFIYANQAAKNLLKININKHIGHPITQACKKLATSVAIYKETQSITIRSDNKEMLIINAIPQLDARSVILTIAHPGIADVVDKNTSLLKNNADKDYLLHLETTSSGQLINHLIPSNTPTLLDFKINLMKATLSGKALLLDVPEEDLFTTVELIHNLRLQSELHIVNIRQPEVNYRIAKKLFGQYPQEDDDHGLLQLTERQGTIFLKNIHLLSLETQEKIAHYLKFGVYSMLGDKKQFRSSAHIICSCPFNMESLVKKEKFSENLYREIQTTTLSFPPLISLSQHELHSIIGDFSDGLVRENTFKKFLSLNSKEKREFVQKTPTSITQLKHKIREFLIKKSKEKNIYDDINFHHEYNTKETFLIQAAQLGKQALKDKKLMQMLWEKFGNQSEIALLLNVNRSSVNRRLKDYSLVITKVEGDKKESHESQ